MDFRFHTPVIIYVNNIISEHMTILQSYLFRLSETTGIPDPLRLFASVIYQQMTGIGYQSHFRETYPEIKAWYTDIFSLYGTDKIREYVSTITDGMCAWKLIMYASFLIRNRCPELLCSPDGKADNMESHTADIDVTTLRSSSSSEEGAEHGYNKKNRGGLCFQLSATSVGRVFADAKLFPGDCDPKDFFQKAVRRIICLGYDIRIIRADSAYMTLGNLLFLKEMKLGYVIGASATSDVAKAGISKFGKLSRQKSSAIISVAKGLSVYDFGEAVLANGVGTRIIIVRRISRKKNRRTGQWKIRTYYYSIATNLSLSPRKIYESYHKRQRIEAGFRELRQHWHLERLPFEKLIHNEFRILCKITAMTLSEIFQAETLPKQYRTLQRKTFFRKVLSKGLKITAAGKVVPALKSQYTWLLRRLLSKTAKINPALYA